MKILLVEDDPSLSKNIKEALQVEGYFVEVVYDGLLAEKLLKNRPFDLVVLDVNLPGVTGFDICKNFRNYNQFTPVIMLTAFGELEDKIQGFDSGADDFLTKPFFIRELLLRIKSLLKRHQNLNIEEHQSIFIYDNLVINDKSKVVSRGGENIILTPREYQILLKLVQSKGELVSKSELIETIWGKSFDANTNTIEVYINFLRKKVDKAFDKQTIKTKVGFGYYLD